MHVWIVQTGEPLHCDKGINRGMRAMNTANALVEAGHKVTIWSSDFYHQEKRHRYGTSKTIKVSELLTIRLIPSCGYTKNVSLRRFKDHKELAVNFLKEIKTDPLPDVAMVGFPPIEIAHTAVEYLEENGVPVLLDVKDQWPDIFSDAVPSFARPLAKLMLCKLHKQSVETMSRATALSAMSGGFLEWSAKRAGRNVTELDLVCPLTTPTPHVSDDEIKEARMWWRSIGIEPTDKLRIMFVGSLSRQFDFKTALEGIRMAKKSNIEVELVICGTGEVEEDLRREFADETSIVFAGWVDYPKYKTLAEMSDIALAPYIVSEAFQLSIPNKVIDALSFSLPILTPLDGEVGNLICGSGVGWMYDENSPDSVSALLSEIAESRDGLIEKSRAAKKLHEIRFDFASVYGKLARKIGELKTGASI